MMARLVVTSPNQPGATFDRDYNARVHLLLCKRHFGSAGMTAGEVLFIPVPDAAFLCVGILAPTDHAAIDPAVGVSGAAEVTADITNLTDVQPTATATA